MTGVYQTHVTKRGVTSRNFNVPISFRALSTGLELPYTRVFVFGQEIALSAHLKCASTSFRSTLVHSYKTLKRSSSLTINLGSHVYRDFFLILMYCTLKFFASPPKSSYTYHWHLCHTGTSGLHYKDVLLPLFDFPAHPTKKRHSRSSLATTGTPFTLNGLVSKDFFIFGF